MTKKEKHELLMRLKSYEEWLSYLPADMNALRWKTMEIRYDDEYRDRLEAIDDTLITNIDNLSKFHVDLADKISSTAAKLTLQFAGERVNTKKAIDELDIEFARLHKWREKKYGCGGVDAGFFALDVEYLFDQYCMIQDLIVSCNSGSDYAYRDAAITLLQLPDEIKLKDNTTKAAQEEIKKYKENINETEERVLNCLVKLRENLYNILIDVADETKDGDFIELEAAADFVDYYSIIKDIEENYERIYCGLSAYLEELADN